MEKLCKHIVLRDLKTCTKILNPQNSYTQILLTFKTSSNKFEVFNVNI